MNTTYQNSLELAHTNKYTKLQSSQKCEKLSGAYGFQCVLCEVGDDCSDEQSKISLVLRRISKHSYIKVPLHIQGRR